ncbi:MAG: DUF1326 domain-containing protein [Pseudomonadota bacterium]|nr:DUF1326 domain-containing protein [Pseudomonadota bacterium]
MSYIDWKIKGPKIASCNCAYGCPCEFNAAPTHGLCEGLEAQRIDERATPEQREALFTILSGKEQEPTTAFNIYGSTIAKEYDPIFARLGFDCDLAKGSGRFVVPGVMSMRLDSSSAAPTWRAAPSKAAARSRSATPIATPSSPMWRTAPSV